MYARLILQQAIILMVLPLMLIVIGPLILGKAILLDDFPLEWYEISLIFGITSIVAFMIAFAIMFNYTKKKNQMPQQYTTLNSLISNIKYPSPFKHLTLNLRKFVLIPLLVSLIMLTTIPLILAQSASFVGDPEITYNESTRAFRAMGTVINDGSVTLTDCRINTDVGPYEYIDDISPGATKSFSISATINQPSTVKLILVTHYSGTTYYSDTYEYSFLPNGNGGNGGNGNGDGNGNGYLSDTNLIVAIAIIMALTGVTLLLTAMGLIKWKKIAKSIKK